MKTVDRLERYYISTEHWENIFVPYENDSITMTGLLDPVGPEEIKDIEVQLL